MNAEDKMIEAIRNKNRQIEMMLEKKRGQTYSSSEEEEYDEQQEGEYEDEGEFAGESEEDEDEEQENYYQQIKKMQLKDDIPNNYKNARFEENKYAHQQHESSDENEEDQIVSKEQNMARKQHDESDNEEENPSFGGMQSKFMGIKVESACMFDEDARQEKVNEDPKYSKSEMEPIQEGYSSDDSFCAQQKQRNLKENIQFLLKENNKNIKINESDKEANNMRNHINVKTSSDEKENINSRNK